MRSIRASSKEPAYCVEKKDMQERIHGTTLPVLEVRLEPGESLVSESGELSWLSSSIDLSTSTGGGGIKGIFKRVASGGTLFMTTYTAKGTPGEVSFAEKQVRAGVVSERSHRVPR